MIIASRRRALLLLSLIVPISDLAAAEPEPAALPQALSALEAAKSKAEDAVHVVKLYPSDNPVVQIGAIRDYGTARAAFNGFIEGLVVERDSEAAASNTTYRRELDQAMQAQKAFLQFVQEKFVDVQPRGGKAPIGDLLEGIGHIFTGLADLGKSAAEVHKEFTRESDDRQQQIRQQLAQLKWQQFSSIQ